MPAVTPKKKDNLFILSLENHWSSGMGVLRFGYHAKLTFGRDPVWDAVQMRGFYERYQRAFDREVCPLKQKSVFTQCCWYSYTLQWYNLQQQQQKDLSGFAFAGGAASHVKLHNTVVCLLCAGWRRQSCPACFVSQKASDTVISV